MKILNFGSMNIDHVYRVAHNVQTGETILSSGLSLFCGGKGLNQSVAVAKAGGEVYHAGLIGTDGDMLLDALTQAGVDVRYVKRKNMASCHTMIQLDDQGRNSIIVHNTEGLQFTEPEMEEILSDFDSGDVLMLQNELVGSPFMLKRAAAKGMTIVLNPSPMDSRIKEYDLKLVHWLLLNEHEGEALTGMSDPEQIIHALKNAYPTTNIVLTLGEKGALCCCNGGMLHQAAFPVKAVDTTGAGDTFTGYFVTGIAHGDPLERVLRRASLASSIAVSRDGAAASIPMVSEVAERE